jgi:hypothetical protein
MNYNCVEQINARLREAGHDYQIAPSLVFDDRMNPDSLLSVYTSWIGEPPRGKKHKPPPAMICTYCPFCRRKTAKAKDTATTKEHEG